MADKFFFAIDRGGTFTDVICICPNGKVRTLKLLSEDPERYADAPREGIRRILQEVIHFNRLCVGIQFVSFRNIASISVVLLTSILINNKYRFRKLTQQLRLMG